jgi:antitoxin (DNA-binding transcriptional repressor) of toxin-antitoxin stability system
MESANVAQFKKHLSAFLEKVEMGETIEICRRNVPIAHVIGVPKPAKNRTVLGCGEGTVTYLGNVTDPFIPQDSWEMLSQDTSAKDYRPA